MKGLILCLSFLSLLLWTRHASSKDAPVVTAYLDLKDVEKIKEGPCVAVHAWATWCHPCLVELPILLKALGSLPGVKPVIIDLSSLGSQEKFSKKWVEQVLKPPFPTYFKPDVARAPYLKAIDPDWDGTLPYSALYVSGKKKKTWVGKSDLESLVKTIQSSCK